MAVAAACRPDGRSELALNDPSERAIFESLTVTLRGQLRRMYTDTAPQFWNRVSSCESDRLERAYPQYPARLTSYAGRRTEEDIPPEVRQRVNSASGPNGWNWRFSDDSCQVYAARGLLGAPTWDITDSPSPSP
jgi:hypothetical protein